MSKESRIFFFLISQYNEKFLNARFLHTHTIFTHNKHRLYVFQGMNIKRRLNKKTNNRNFIKQKFD